MISRRTLVAAALASPLPGGSTSAARGGDSAFYLPALRAPADPRARVIQGAAEQAAALAGDELRALQDDPRDQTGALDLAGASVVDAIDLIVERARSRRVVILNEAHNVSRCRAFGHAVALRLREVGFDLFAAETFTTGAPALRAFEAGGPLTSEVGFYSRDPVFAEMLRGARQAGYSFVAYEERQDQRSRSDDVAAAREADEATNLAAALSRRPRTRAFVYCGEPHNLKVRRGGRRTMGSWLAELTQSDPLSIDQGEGWPSLDVRPWTKVDRVLSRFPIERPSALIRADGNALALADDQQEGLDIQVVHPRLPLVDGRPGWLVQAPGRRRSAYTLPNGLTAGDLAQEIPLDEAMAAANTVPADQYPLMDCAKQAVFYLRPGRYLARAETAAGQRLLGTFAV